MELSDFVVTNVADADNAALDLRAAALSIDSTTQHFKDYDKLEPAIPLTDAEVRGISEVVKDNAAAFAGVERAVTKKGVDWQIAFKSPAVQILLPDLSHMRELANLVGYRALLEHQQGNDAAALRDLDHLLFIADAVDQQPTLVSHLVATGIRAIVANRIEQIAPDLKIGTSNGGCVIAAGTIVDRKIAGRTYCRRGAASRVSRGARDRAGRGALHRGRTDEPRRHDVARSVDLGAAAANVAVSIIGGPMFLADGLLMIQQTTKLMQAVDHSPNWPAYRAAAPPMPPEMMQSPFRHVLARIMMPSFDRAIQTHFRSSADRRMTAVALAIACYRAEHGGKFPATLDELIPAELASIPADPMSAAGKIKYVAATTQPIVYSIGEDGIDNGGSEASTTNRPVRSEMGHAGCGAASDPAKTPTACGR